MTIADRVRSNYKPYVLNKCSERLKDSIGDHHKTFLMAPLRTISEQVFKLMVAHPLGVGYGIAAKISEPPAGGIATILRI